MKAKTLLIAAAALAAGVISSQAQTPVYSQNIVGYVNIPAKTGYVNVANPLDCGNSLTNVIPNSGQWDYTYVYIFNGTGYTIYTLDSTMPTGVADQNDSVAVTAPTIKPGQAFFFYNNTGVSNIVTVTGSVHVDGVAAGSQAVGSSTNVLTSSPQLNFYGSVIPVGGGLGSVLGFPTNGSADYAYVQVPNISPAGQISGFTTYTVDSTLGGFADQNDSVAVPEPIIPVGTGFFFYNNLGAPVNWTQSF